MATDAGTQGTPQVDLDQENMPFSICFPWSPIWPASGSADAHLEKLEHTGDRHAMDDRSIKDTSAKTRSNSGICCQVHMVFATRHLVRFLQLLPPPTNHLPEPFNCIIPL